MSRNIIEISSEDDSNDCMSNLKSGNIHTLSSSDSEVELSSPSTIISSKRKSYKIPKLSSNMLPTTSFNILEDFPSPSKLDVFKSSLKDHTTPKKSSCDFENSSTNNSHGSKQECAKKKREYSPKESIENPKFPDSLDENENLDDSISSIKSHTISDSNSDSSSISLPSPVTKKKKKTKQKQPIVDKQLERQKKAEEKSKKKKEELELKAKKKQKAESLRKFKPGECLKHLTTRLDVAITQEPYGNDVLANLDALDTKYEIISQPLPSTVTWARDGNNSEEDLLLIIWSGERFVNLVAEMKTVDEVNKSKRTFSNKRIILVIFGFDFYMKKLKKDKCTKSNNLSQALKTLTKSDVELAMIQIQLLCKCNCKILDTRADVALHVSQATKSVAEMPFRLEKQKLEEKSDWHASSDSKDCVKVDRLGNGLGRLWRQQLSQFNNVTLDISEAIAQVYKTPTSLIKAYEVCSSRREGEKLLADIIVRRGRGPSASSRTVGKELSRKIYCLFNSRDPEQHLSQVQDV